MYKKYICHYKYLRNVKHKLIQPRAGTISKQTKGNCSATFTRKSFDPGTLKQSCRAVVIIEFTFIREFPPIIDVFVLLLYLNIIKICGRCHYAGFPVVFLSLSWGLSVRGKKITVMHVKGFLSKYITQQVRGYILITPTSGSFGKRQYISFHWRHSAAVIIMQQEWCKHLWIFHNPLWPVDGGLACSICISLPAMSNGDIMDKLLHTTSY